jgi:hypothetical protein
MTDSDSNVSRRDTLRLATALSALGVGLGVVSSKNAEAQVLKGSTVIDAQTVGQLSIKFYKFAPSGQAPVLLHALDLGSLLQRLGNVEQGAISVKLFAAKGGASRILSENDFNFTNLRSLKLEAPAVTVKQSAALNVAR